MGISRILDRFVKEKTRLEAKVYAGGFKATILDARLVEYDNDSYLFEIRDGCGERMTYVPRHALFHIKFAAKPAVASRDAEPAAGKAENLDEEHSFMGVTYNPKTRELSGGGHREFVKSEKYHLALTLLFINAGSDSHNPIPINNFTGLPEGEQIDDKRKHALGASFSRLNKILHRFGLSVYALPNKGYTLGGVSE